MKYSHSILIIYLFIGWYSTDKKVYLVTGVNLQFWHKRRISEILCLYIFKKKKKKKKKKNWHRSAKHIPAIYLITGCVGSATYPKHQYAKQIKYISQGVLCKK